MLIDMRKKSGKSQQQMADHINKSLRMYQYYEHGTKDISAKDLFRLCQYCKYYPVVERLKDFISFFGNRTKQAKEPDTGHSHIGDTILIRRKRGNYWHDFQY